MNRPDGAATPESVIALPIPTLARTTYAAVAAGRRTFI
jgi:hypothetical protein